MRQSEFDKIKAAIDRAEFALDDLQKSERITLQVSLGKSAGRDCRTEGGGCRTRTATTKYQRCSPHRQSGPSPPTDPR